MEARIVGEDDEEEKEEDIACGGEGGAGASGNATGGVNAANAKVSYLPCRDYICI